MSPDLIYYLNQERQREQIARAEQARLASLANPSNSLASVALLALANGLISGGQRLKNFAQRRRTVYQTTSAWN